MRQSWLSPQIANTSAAPPVPPTATELLAAWVRETGIKRALAVLVFVVLPVVAALVIAFGRLPVIR